MPWSLVLRDALFECQAAPLACLLSSAGLAAWAALEGSIIRLSAHAGTAYSVSPAEQAVLTHGPQRLIPDAPCFPPSDPVLLLHFFLV